MFNVLKMLERIVYTDKQLKLVMSGDEPLHDQRLTEEFKVFTGIQNGEYHPPGEEKIRLEDYDRFSLASMLKLQLDAYREYKEDGRHYLNFIIHQRSRFGPFNLHLFGPMGTNINLLHDYTFEQEDLSLSFIDDHAPVGIYADVPEWFNGCPITMTQHFIQNMFDWCRTPFEAYELAYRIASNQLYLTYESADRIADARLRISAHPVGELKTKDSIQTDEVSLEEGESLSLHDYIQAYPMTIHPTMTLSGQLYETLDRWIYGTSH